MKVKHIGRGTLLAFVLLLLLPVAVLAYTYSANIVVTESGGTSYTSLPVLAVVDNDYLIANAYMATGLDTRMREATTELPHMLAGDKTLFAVPIAASEQLTLKYTLGDTPLTAFYIIAGYDSCIVTPDDATLVLGDIFEFEIKGYIDTSAGANKDIVYKQDAFRIYINAADSLRAAMLAGGDAEILITTIALTTGNWTIKVIADGGDLEIWVDGVLQGSTPLLGATVPNNGNIWRINRNNVSGYMEYIKLEVD